MVPKWIGILVVLFSILAIVCVLILMATEAKPTPEMATPAKLKWPRIILYGDSITQYAFSNVGGWGSLLADKLQRKCDIINRGFSGYNTRWNLLMMPKLFSKQDCENIAAVTIFLGANDSNKPENPTQYVPVDEYEENLVKIVIEFGKFGVVPEKIVVIGPPPCDEIVWGNHCKETNKPFTKDDKIVGVYSLAAERAAHKCNVDFVDLYTNMKKQKGWEHFLSDGLHLSQKGAHFLDSLLWPIIEKKTQHLPTIMPLWNEVDYENPQTSLK